MAQKPTPAGDYRADGATSVGRAHLGPTRRQALVGSGLVLGAAALSATPFLGGLLASIGRVFQPTVGVVAPPSTRYPDLLGQLASGVRRGLVAGGQPDAPVLARASANSAPSSVAATARELVTRDKVDLVLVYANPTDARLLGQLAEETGVPVVVVDPGAQIVTSADAEPRVLSHSLGHWQSIWALGSWAAGATGGSVYVISSLYESGFDVLNAFEHGLTKAGGSVAGTSITHVKAGDTADAVRKAVASGAGAIFLAASGHEADDILTAIAASKAASRMSLLVPGLSADRLAAAPTLSAFTALTWPVAEKTAFQMLGEDVGALVAAAVDGGRKALPVGATALAGARGEISLDLATGRTDVPVRIHSVTASGSTVAYKPVATQANTSQATAFADAIVPELRTGWLDVYGSSL